MPSLFSRFKNLFSSESKKGEKEFRDKLYNLFKEGKEVEPYLEELFKGNKKLALEIFKYIASMAENSSDADEDKITNLLKLWECLDSSSYQKHKNNLKQLYLKEVKRIDISPLITFQKSLKPGKFATVVNSASMINTINEYIGYLKLLKSSGYILIYNGTPPIFVDVNKDIVLKIQLLRMLIGSCVISILTQMESLGIDTQKHKDKISSTFGITLTKKTDVYNLGARYEELAKQCTFLGIVNRFNAVVKVFNSK